jgi:hypothetical protein
LLPFSLAGCSRAISTVRPPSRRDLKKTKRHESVTHTKKKGSVSRSPWPKESVNHTQKRETEKTKKKHKVWFGRDFHRAPHFPWPPHARPRPRFSRGVLPCAAFPLAASCATEVKTFTLHPPTPCFPPLLCSCSDFSCPSVWSATFEMCLAALSTLHYCLIVLILDLSATFPKIHIFLRRADSVSPSNRSSNLSRVPPVGCRSPLCAW